MEVCSGYLKRNSDHFEPREAKLNPAATHTNKLKNVVSCYQLFVFESVLGRIHANSRQGQKKNGGGNPLMIVSFLFPVQDESGSNSRGSISCVCDSK
jgi:hypothetical protein